MMFSSALSRPPASRLRRDASNESSPVAWANATCASLISKIDANMYPWCRPELLAGVTSRPSHWDEDDLASPSEQRPMFCMCR